MEEKHKKLPLGIFVSLNENKAISTRYAAEGDKLNACFYILIKAVTSCSIHKIDQQETDG